MQFRYGHTPGKQYPDKLKIPVTPVKEVAKKRAVSQATGKGGSPGYEPSENVAAEGGGGNAGWAMCYYKRGLVNTWRKRQEGRKGDRLLAHPFFTPDKVCGQCKRHRIRPGRGERSAGGAPLGEYPVAGRRQGEGARGYAEHQRNSPPPRSRGGGSGAYGYFPTLTPDLPRDRKK